MFYGGLLPKLLFVGNCDECRLRKNQIDVWKHPREDAGLYAEDEYNLPLRLDPAVYEARIKIHRSEYISERDFITIKSWGLDTVRIPVPYFIFGDREPFIGCIEELDKAFNWAERYGLKILIDLHTAPMSQNGFDNGGISGVIRWAQLPEEVEFELSVLERLAKRYGKREGLWGIEVINEPIMESMWNQMKPMERYPAADPELAKGSTFITEEFLRQYYLDAYDVIRPHIAEDKYIVMHDGFEMKAWKDFMQEDKYDRAVLDTHLYLMVAEMSGCEQTVEGYTKFIEENYRKGYCGNAAILPCICGEWCLFNSLTVGHDTKGGQSVLNGMEAVDDNVMTPEEKRDIYRALNKASLDAWNTGSGYFYWSYKLLTDTVNTAGWAGWDSWDMGRCVDFGWFEVERKF